MKILDIAFKDLIQSFRNTFAIGMMFVVPLLIAGLIYFAFGGMNAGVGRFNLPTLTVAIVNQDTPTQDLLNLGKMIEEFMRDERMPGWMKIVSLNDETAARAAFDKQEIGVAVLIPHNLSDAALSPTASANITILHDPTLTFGPAFVKDVIGLFLDGITGGKIALTVVSNEMSTSGKPADATMQQAIYQQYSTWYTTLQNNLHHSEDSVLSVQAPAVSDTGAKTDPFASMMGKVMAGMMIFFVFFTGVNTAQTILREEEEGTLARLFTTPTARATILAGKFTSVFITILVQVIVLLIASALAFKINWGQPLSIAFVTLGLLVIAAGFGILVVSFVKNARQAGPVVGGVLTVTSMLGGLFTLGMSMPEAFNTMTLAMPQGWAIRGWKLVLDGASIGEVIVPVAVMIVLGAIFFVIGVNNFRKRFG